MKTPIALTIATLLLSHTLTSAAAEPPLAPAPIPSAMAGDGYALSWDGRIFIYTQFLKPDPVYPKNGWQIRVFRPERLAEQCAQAPASCAPPVLTGDAFSPPSLLEETCDVASGFAYPNALAITPGPLPQGALENPHRSTADGTFDPNGAYETYRMRITTQRYRVCEDNRTLGACLQCPDCEPGTSGAPCVPIPRADRLGVRSAYVVIEHPRTPQAQVIASDITPFVEMSAGSCDGGPSEPLRGIEPTLTFDGHLMVWQGHAANDGTTSRLVYSYNDDPDASCGWSTPRSIVDMHHFDRDTLVAGIKLQYRYPIARQPLRTNDGTPFPAGDEYLGAYPWLSKDGTELFHTTYALGNALHGGLSVIGRWTGYALRHIDGPLNPDRSQTKRLFFSSPGPTLGMWAPYRDVPGVPIPYTKSRPVYPLFGSNTANYGEVSFEDYVDGDYLVVLHMNEALAESGGWLIDTSRTPDTSGHHNNATLGPLATGATTAPAFTQEAMADPSAANDGVGASQSLFFEASDELTIASSASLQAPRAGTTVELWVKRLAAPAAARRLAERSGAWSLSIDASGKLQIDLRTTAASWLAPMIGSGIPLDQWTHVAFSYDHNSGDLRAYQNGAQILSVKLPGTPSPLATTTAPLHIGPGDTTAPSGTAELQLDELKLSRIVRDAAAIRTSAFADQAPPAFTGSLPSAPPLGLQDAPLHLTEDITATQIALGKQLFFDPRLSENGQVACSSCHDPSRGFSDHFATSVGVSGTPLTRNAPALINRALGSSQLWDGAAASLQEQAPLPLAHPDEMGLSLAQAAQAIDAIPGYAGALQAAYNSTATSETLLPRALADYQRSLLSGGSRVDLYEHGLPYEGGPALTAQEALGRALFRGKARCTACHAGPNYSDESFHNNGFHPGTPDPGRMSVTGRERDLGRFKTPTLRDVALSAPYLHDGSVDSLEELVALYNQGGLSSHNQDSEIRPLGLSAQEQAALVAFLRALTGSSVDRSLPSLPDGCATSTSGCPGSGPMQPARARGTFVWALYLDLLGRTPDPGGFAFHVALHEGGAPRLSTADAFLTSQEHLGRVVDQAFDSYLNRTPDQLGRDFYVSELSQTHDLHSFWLTLSTSDEYHGPYPTGSDYVTALYGDILGRAPGSEALDWYVPLLSSHSDVFVAANLLASQERCELEITAAYQALLDRTPTSQELSCSSIDPLDIWGQLAAGDEYAARSLLR